MKDCYKFHAVPTGWPSFMLVRSSVLFEGLRAVDGKDAWLRLLRERSRFLNRNNDIQI